MTKARHRKSDATLDAETLRKLSVDHLIYADHARERGDADLEAEHQQRADACLAGADALKCEGQTCGNCKHIGVSLTCLNEDAPAHLSFVQRDDCCRLGWAPQETGELTHEQMIENLATFCRRWTVLATKYGLLDVLRSLEATTPAGTAGDGGAMTPTDHQLEELVNRIRFAPGQPTGFAMSTAEAVAALRAIIDAKVAGEEVVAPKADEAPKVIDLMEALRRSLDQVSAGKKPAAKAESAWDPPSIADEDHDDPPSLR